MRGKIFGTGGYANSIRRFVAPREGHRRSLPLMTRSFSLGHIVIHCSAGIGRTGLFTAYLAKRCLGLSGYKALQRVRRFIPRAVETPEQQRFVLHDDEL